MLSEDFIADTIEIHAYSSVEGSETVNKKLQELRARNIADAISSNQKEKLTTLIYSKENWDLFEKQIQRQNALAEFKNLSRENVKKNLEDTLKQKKFESFLSQQRVAHIRLHAKELVTNKNIEKYLTRKVSTLKKRIASSATTGVKKENVILQLDSLQFYMEISYNKIKEGIIKPIFFKNFDIGKDTLYNDYNSEKLKYKIQISGVHTDDTEWLKGTYDDLVSLYNNGGRSFFINYNMLNLVQQYGKRINVKIAEDSQLAFVNELRALAATDDEMLLANKLGLNFWFQICRLPVIKQPASKLPVFEMALNNIHSYFKMKNLHTGDLNKLAAYYLYQLRPDWVIELLWPEYEKRKANPEGLQILAKTIYQNYEETNNTEYYDFLKEIFPLMGKEKWCPMFVGPCNISFQAFDYENFRNFYCSKCNDFLNYAKAPQQTEEK